LKAWRVKTRRLQEAGRPFSAPLHGRRLGTRIAASSRFFSIQHSGHHWLQPQVVRSRPRRSRHLLISASQIVRLLSDYCQIIKRLTGAGVGTAIDGTTLRAAQPDLPKFEHTVPERVCAVVDHSQASFASSPSQLSRAPPPPSPPRRQIGHHERGNNYGRDLA